MLAQIRKLLAWRPPWFFAAFAHMIFIAWSSHRTWEGTGPSFPGAGNLMHVPLYFVLGTFTGAACGVGRSAVSKRALVTGVAWAALFGIADEVHQSFVPGRTPSVQDAIVDLLSAVAAVSVLRAFGGAAEDRVLRLGLAFCWLFAAAAIAVVPSLLS